VQLRNWYSLDYANRWFPSGHGKPEKQNIQNFKFKNKKEKKGGFCIIDTIK